jgi:3-methylfumaryl-CoA hydratase
MAVTLDRDPGFRVGDQLPPAWHWLYFHDLVKASELSSEGHPRLGIVMPPVPLPRRMWAGGSFLFKEPLVLGDTVDRVSVIRSIVPKKGRSGPLFFVTVEHVLRTGVVENLVEKQTIVYRPMSTEEGLRASPPAPTGADVSRQYKFNSTVLFRYSALTFNGHRIHYDADYCRAEEGYPNVVIHGPLIATLLLDLYYRQGRRFLRFAYRARNPLMLPHEFTVNGKAEGRSVTLWAANHLGGLAMEADGELA